MANEELRVPIGIPVETDAAKAADSIQALRDSIAKSKDAIKESALAMRDLRGKSDEVKAAKDQLVTKIRAEEAAVAASTLKLLKQGTSVEELAKKEKKAEEAKKKRAEATKEEADAMGKAIGTVGGPVASLKGKLESLKAILGGTEGGMAAVAGVAAIAAAAVVSVGVAAGAAAFSLSKFILASADAARMMQLTRKANLAGNDEWAKNLGDQVDAIARKVPVAKDKLNELGIALAKSRIGGQTMVDTMNAVAGASAAAGEDLGNKLKSMVERGAFTKRFQLSPQELLGMDLDFSDVAKAYASGMHISVEAARQALFLGRVRLADGAAALKKAVDAKFGEINADKMLGLDNQLMKFKADLAGLAKDVNIQPILKGIKSLADNFDQASVNGKALKGIFTTIGRAIGVTFQDGVPIVQDFIDKAVWGALKIENYWLRAKIAFRETFGTKTSLEWAIFKTALTGVVDTVAAFIPGLSQMIALWKVVGTITEANTAAFTFVKDEVTALKASIEGIGWKATGGAIVDGITSGLEAGGRKLVDKVKNLADDVKHAFTSTLHIQSPSKDFFDYGKQLPAGAKGGIEAGTPAVHAAAAAMAPVPGGGASLGGSSGNARSTISVTFNPTIVIQGGAGGDLKENLKDPSLLQQLNEHFLAMVRAAGVEVPA